MVAINDLKAIVAELMKVEAETVAGPTVLGGVLATSLGRARLDAALRGRLGITNAGVYTVSTFGELCQLLGVDGAGESGSPPASTRPARNGQELQGTGVALGVDIQAVETLPQAADYWEEGFYRQHFTQQEIAYALLQPHPRESFAAAWCAKEALRKADSRWVGVDWKLTEITHDAEGRPALQTNEDAMPHAVSLSHSNGFAVAVVAMVGATAPVQGAVPVVAAALPQSAPEPHTESRLPLLVSAAALLVSLATAAYAVWR